MVKLQTIRVCKHFNYVYELRFCSVAPGKRRSEVAAKCNVSNGDSSSRPRITINIAVCANLHQVLRSDLYRGFFEEFTTGCLNKILVRQLNKATREGIVEWLPGNLSHNAVLWVSNAGLSSLSLHHSYLEKVSLNGQGHDINCDVEFRDFGLWCGFHMYLHKRTFMAYV